MAKEKAAKIKKPIYKKWWFWLIIAILVISAPTSMGDNTEETASADTETEQTTEVESQNEAILLIAGQAGQYGTTEKLEQDGEILKEYIAYRVPAGTYTVTNKGSNATQVTIYKNGSITNEDGNVEQVMSDTKPLLIDPDASDTLSINDNEYISIVEPASIELVLQ